MSICHLCRTAGVSQILDCGLQPISNRFLASPAEAEFMHRIVMGQCEACGLVQLTDPPPAEELRPRHEWITYNEPEGHLDQLVDRLAELPGLSRDSTICGVSFKDDSTLRRMKERGFHRVWRIDPEGDLGIKEPGAGVETIQDRLDPRRAAALAHKYGRCDVIVARQIVEHAHDVSKFMQALKELATPGGYVVIEVPDCERGMDQSDYGLVWEEHVVYFTPVTFRNSFIFCGFSLAHFERIPYLLEDCLLGIGKLEGQTGSGLPSVNVLEKEKRRAWTYSEGLGKKQAGFENFLRDYRQNCGKIALFGAGHHACTFINLFHVRDYMELVVDDHPKKKGLFMPGSKLPIRGSAALVENGIKLCLLSLNPDSEEKVIQKNREFLGKGGTFSSIFPASRHALQI